MSKLSEDHGSAQGAHDEIEEGELMDEDTTGTHDHAVASGTLEGHLGNEFNLQASSELFAQVPGSSGTVSAKNVKMATKKERKEGYKIRPEIPDKFRPGVVQSMIESVVNEYFKGKIYSPDDVGGWIKEVTDLIQFKIKAQNYNRYKIITYVTVGERRGEGVANATRCLWDAESDCLSTWTFLSDTIFCVATVYGIYFY